MTKRRNPLDRYASDIAPGEVPGLVFDPNGANRSSQSRIRVR